MHRKGFTLVELLVCIAIICLLMALLAPLIKTMRDRAKAVACGSNLRQISTLWLMYIHEHKGYFPFRVNSVTTYRQLWGTRGVEYTCPPKLRIFGIAFPEVDVKMFHCPSDTGAGAAGWPANRYPTLYHHAGYSYRFNTSASNNSDKDGLFGKNIGNIGNPTEVVAAADCSFCSVYFRGDNPFQYMYWHDAGELGWGNVLFVDGSVRYLKIPDSKKFQQGPGYTFFWNGPR
ncbi:type II secretion system protein [Planctomycetota bacterium]